VAINISEMWPLTTARAFGHIVFGEKLNQELVISEEVDRSSKGFLAGQTRAKSDAASCSG